MNENRVNIQYNFTMKCNQRCSYCWFKNILDKDNYEPTIDNINCMIKHLKMYKIDDFVLSGGELSINKNTLYIIDKIFSELDVKRIKLLTNVYNRTFFENLLKQYDESNFYVYMALHPQFYSERYVNNYIYIKENFSKYTLSLLLDKRYKKNLYSFYPIYEKKFLENTYFNGIRCSDGSSDNGVNYIFHSNEFTDLKFLKEFASVYGIDFRNDIIEWKRVPDEYKGKKCINNFFFINNDGTIKYDEQCFGYDLENNNIYIAPYKFPYMERICDFTYQCWCMCKYNYVIH